MTGAYIQMIIALAAVIGLILLMGFFVRKKQGKAGLMSILAYQSFGPRKGVAALKIGKEILLLGITSTEFKLLKTFAQDELDAEIGSDITYRLSRLRNMKEHLSEYK
ncbi:MAG: hypothetical protein FD151_693 [bacterium]|nr:MAG: hypothetical protein FD151_693 [bacterium]